MKKNEKSINASENDQNTFWNKRLNEVRIWIIFLSAINIVY
jgi:hypothetical protein